MTYHNITLLAVEPEEVADWLAENGFPAYISPMLDDITVVYDGLSLEADEPATLAVADDEVDPTDPLEQLLLLVSELSYELGCTAWLMLCDEAQTCIYSIYIDGNLVEQYGASDALPPSGGNPEFLAELFEQPKRVIKDLRAVLNRHPMLATERHEKLLKLLGVPPLALNIGYEQLQQGALPHGMTDLEAFIWIGEVADDDEL